VIDFSIVIATYNDAPHLRRNVLRLHEYLRGTRLNYEFVFVDDGSQDHTRHEVEQVVATLKSMGVVCLVHHHEFNKGRGAAVSTGIYAARGQIVGFIDIDLEPLMDSLLPLYQSIHSGQFDVMVGRRAIANAIAKPIRVLSSYVYRWLAHLVLRLPVADTECGLKLFNRAKVLTVLDQCQDTRWFWDTEVVHRSWTSGLKVGEHWIVFFEDRTKQSTVRLLPDTWNYIKAMIKYKRLLRLEAERGLNLGRHQA
jgi:glycosyltransferase involved in cell wall biosynthesis